MDRRTYAREYARRQRDRRWAAEAADKTACPRMLGNGRRCKWTLESRFVGGKTVPFCAQCDRKRRGICLDCQSAPVVGLVGKSLRCADCRKIARIEASAASGRRHPSTRKRQWKRRKAVLAANPDQRERELERKRLWRKASPKKVRAYKEAWNQSETARAYYREYYRRMAESRRQLERDRAAARKRGERLTHPCVDCGSPLVGRPKKCQPCRDREYRAARAVLAGAAA